MKACVISIIVVQTLLLSKELHPRIQISKSFFSEWIEVTRNAQLGPSKPGFQVIPAALTSLKPYKKLDLLAPPNIAEVGIRVQ